LVGGCLAIGRVAEPAACPGDIVPKEQQGGLPPEELQVRQGRGA